MINKKFKSDVVFSYVAQVGVMALSFVFLSLVTKYSGVDTFGAFALLTAFSGIIANLFAFRTNEAVVRFYREGKVTGDQDKCRFSLLAGIILDILMGLCVFLLLWNYASNISAQFLKSQEATEAVQLYAIVVLSAFVCGTPKGYLQAVEKFNTLNFFLVSGSLVKVIAFISFIYLENSLNIYHVILSALLAEISVSLFLVVILIYELMKLNKVEMRKESVILREYVIFSFKTFLSTTLKSGNRNVDSVVLGYLTDTTTVGVYATFRQFLVPIAFLSNPFTSIVYPKFVEAIVERRQSVLKITVQSVNKKLWRLYVVLIVAIVFTLLLYVSWMELNLTIDQYLALLFMIMSAFISGLLWWARPFSNAVDPMWSLKANLLAVLILLVIIYPLTEQFAIVGTAASMFIMTVFLRMFWKKKFDEYA